MLRRLICGLFAMALFTGILLADQAKGKFKKYEKRTLTLTVGDKETEFKLNKETKVYQGDTELKEKEDRRKMWQELKEGADVTVNYDKEGDKITVKEVKVKK